MALVVLAKLECEALIYTLIGNAFHFLPVAWTGTDELYLVFTYDTWIEINI